MNIPIALLVVAGIMGGALVIFCIVRLVGAVSRSVVGRYPLVAHQKLQLEDAGSLTIHLETPQLSMAGFGVTPRSWKARLREIDSGTEMPMRANVFGAEVSGLSKKRRPLWNVTVERPGGYELSVEGLSGRTDIDACSFVIAKPLGTTVALSVLGIVVGAGLLIASFVFALIDLSAQRGGS